MISTQKPLSVDLPSDREVRVVRKFNAPRRLVWEAHTRPELLRRWLLGPDGWSMSTCEVDFRVGGAYHYRWTSDAGDQPEFGFHGTHEAIEPHRRIVTREYMDGNDGPGALNTLVLEEKDGVTTLTLTMDFGSREARDFVVSTGMTDGMEASYARLERVLPSPEPDRPSAGA
jgi:uncharacterized protein YndB with AHSA1/START domain